MGNFAKLDENNLVVDILALPEESDDHYLEYLNDVLGLAGNWVNATVSPFAANSGQVGHYYVPDLNIFIRPKPFDSWVLAHTTNKYYYWKAPVEYPQDGNDYIWNEETISWDLVQE
jgi:hypothetical protein